MTVACIAVEKIVGQHLEEQHDVVRSEADARRIPDAPRALQLCDQRLHSGASIVVPRDVVRIVDPIRHEDLHGPRRVVERPRKRELLSLALQRADRNDTWLDAALRPGSSLEVEFGDLASWLIVGVALLGLPPHDVQDGLVDVLRDVRLDDVERTLCVDPFEDLRAIPASVDPYTQLGLGLELALDPSDPRADRRYITASERRISGCR